MQFYRNKNDERKSLDSIDCDYKIAVLVKHSLETGQSLILVKNSQFDGVRFEAISGNDFLHEYAILQGDEELYAKERFDDCCSIAAMDDYLENIDHAYRIMDERKNMPIDQRTTTRKVTYD